MGCIGMSFNDSEGDNISFFVDSPYLPSLSDDVRDEEGKREWSAVTEPSAWVRTDAAGSISALGPSELK